MGLDGGQRPASRLLNSSNALSSSAGGSSSRNANGPRALSFPGESSSFLTYTQGESNPRSGTKRAFSQTSCNTDTQRSAVMRRTQPPASMSQPSSSPRVDNNGALAQPSQHPKLKTKESRSQNCSLSICGPHCGMSSSRKRTPMTS